MSTSRRWTKLIMVAGLCLGASATWAQGPQAPCGSSAQPEKLIEELTKLVEVQRKQLEALTPPATSAEAPASDPWRNWPGMKRK